MITPAQAEALIKSCQLSQQAELKNLFEIFNGVFAENIVADTDLPPFDRVMMDGVAIREKDFTDGIRTYRIAGIQSAGSEPLTLSEPGTCIEIMTGAVCCHGADIVIPYEQCTIEGEHCIIQSDHIKPFQNIHRRGTDNKAGDILIHEGATFGAAEAGICASVGKSKVLMCRLPKVVIFSSGEELVEISDTPLPYQIRKSNVFVLEYMLRKLGISATCSHLADDAQIIHSTLSRALEQYDIILMSGGVSKGKFDLIPTTLADLGVEKLFHRIAQKPGKPMWFGRKNTTIVFGFPGNPVSTMMCAVRYLLPWLKENAFGMTTYPDHVVISEKQVNKSDLTFYQAVKIEGYDDAGNRQFAPIKHNGSGDFAGLAGAAGFIEILPHSTLIKGEKCRFWSIH
jgi:molybdopterin molybdotransferase